MTDALFWASYAVGFVITSLISEADEGERTVCSFIAFGAVWPLVWFIAISRVFFSMRF